MNLKCENSFGSIKDLLKTFIRKTSQFEIEQYLDEIMFNDRGYYLTPLKIKL